MESLARFLVTVAELFEAEGQALRRQLVRLFVAAGLGLIVLGLVIAGICFLLFSLFTVLAAWLTPAGATLVMGVVAMLLAWGVLLRVSKPLRSALSVAARPVRGSPTEAKAALIESAKAIDPLAPMRERPFTTVGVAAGIGAVLGMDRRRLIASARLTRAITSLLRLVAVGIEKYVIARADPGRLR